MNLTIVPRADNITHVILAGRLDSNGAEEISESFSQATAGRGQSAIVDLSDVDFMVSRGIGLFLANGSKLRKAGHKLVVLNPQALVRDGFHTTRTDTVTPIAADWDEAIRLVQGIATPAKDANRLTETAADAPRLSQSQIEVPSVQEGELKLAVKNEIVELKSVMTTLAQFFEAHHVPHRAAYAINLAVDELVVNVIRYAFVDDDPHMIDLELQIRGEQVILRIVDDGRPFDPRSGPALDLHAEERQAGGLGLIMVLDMVDVLNYQRRDDKNHVEVRVRIADNRLSDQ
jgi:serine/threonine-protein kinase RsbW